MFEQHRQPRALPEIGVASIQRCFGRSARSFLDFDNPHSIMSGTNQPYIHKFIADSLFDFDEGKLHGYEDRKSTRLNSSHSQISYAVFCLKKKKKIISIISTLALTGHSRPT